MSDMQRLALALFVLLLSTIGTLVYTIAVIETKLDLVFDEHEELNQKIEKHREKYP